ncbi:MAG: hypothetical protein HY812_04345 [Planctomycetes bacterium]|nr:hypothetical protein [Planctomycetota bacterium]
MSSRTFSNKHGRLTGADGRVVAVSDPTGTRFKRVVTGVADVKGRSLTPAGRSRAMSGDSG